MLDTAAIPITELLAAPSAALAPHGGRASVRQRRVDYAIPAYPLVYGENVWVEHAPVISERMLPTGQIERIQVISVGRLGQDDSGQIEEIEMVAYDNCCRALGPIDPDDVRYGTPDQPVLAEVFYVPCKVNCCECEGTGEPPSYANVGDSIEVTVNTEDNDLHAWALYVDTIPRGTVWSNSAGSSTFIVNVPIDSQIILLPIPTEQPIPPIMQLTHNAADNNTIGIFQGNIVALNYTGTPIPADNTPSALVIRGDIDGSLSGLAAVKTVTNCQHPPTFKVLKGKTVRNYAYANRVIDPATALDTDYTPGQVVLNTTSNQAWTVTAANTPPNGFDADIGDLVVIYTPNGSSQYLPDVWLNVVQSVGGGLNTVVHPNFAPDYEYLVESNDYCAAKNYCFAGVIERQTLEYWMEDAAPQSGLILTRRGNRRGFHPDYTDEKPTRLFTSKNGDNFKYCWLPWDEHASNRVIYHWHNPDKCNYATAIVQDTKLSEGRISYVEEPLTWEYVNKAEQVAALGVQYYNSIIFQRRIVSFRTTMAGFRVDPGDLFIATDPSWETGPEYSGRAAVVAGNEIQADWEPVIAYGQNRSTGSNSITDPRFDFTQFVSVGDVAVANDSTHRTVTAVSTNTLTLDGPYAPNSGYKILDTTVDGMKAAYYNPLNDSFATDLPVTAAYNASIGRVVYTINGVPEGAVLAIAKTFPLYRCSQVEVVKTDEYIVRGTVYYNNLDKPIRSTLIL